jgi:hypothetical protein
MKGYILILFILLVQVEGFSQTKESTKINKEVIDWLENLFITEGYFHEEKDPTKRLTSLTSEEIKGLYHVFLIEKQSFDSVSISIFHAGVNYSHAEDAILIYKQYKGESSIFIQIKNTSYIDDLKQLYKFFETYKKFSDKAKLNCYERIIGNYTVLENNVK